MTPNLSIILLAYNEEACIVGAIHACRDYLDALPGSHELLVVDDGSTDRTAALARHAAVTRGHGVRLLSHERNRGMGAGMRTGIMAARGTHFCVLAADLQVRPGALDAMLPLLERADIVLSGYHRRDDGPLRKVYSRGFRAALALLAGIRVNLEGVYLFPVDTARSVLAEEGVGSDTFLFSFELIDLAVRRGLTTAHTLIACHPREHGQSKVANPRRIARILGEIVAIRRRRSA